MAAPEEPAPEHAIIGAATPVAEPEAYGPLELTRYRKDDGRSLILFEDASAAKAPG